MAGIYIHIPFCKQACHYCNFHFSTSLHRKNDLVEALLKETALQAKYLNGEEIDTVYFGGGTPSLLTKTELQRILEEIYAQFLIASSAEITLETNPDDIDENRLDAWHKAGINRLSIGVQSFFDRDLLWMNRAHDAGQSIKSLEASVRAGFENITIDLIYGTPQLNDKDWEENVKRAILIGIPHISCYALTVESKTALYKLIKEKKIQDVNPDDQARQFLLLMDWMAAAGYEHYEISNFCKPGKRSRHNLSYWQGKKYLGLGPSAHSFNGKSRQWNISNNSLYVQSLQKEILPFEMEEISTLTSLNEYIMTSLRTAEGCDLDLIKERFGEELSVQIRKSSSIWVGRNKLYIKDASLVLTREGNYWLME